MTRHIVEYERDRVLMDRQTLALLSERSEHTIRARCRVVEYRDGKAMYDMEECAGVLGPLACRQRAAA